MEGLTLSRQLNEAVVINAGDGKIITVTVTRIKGDNVRLNIQAPRDIPVHRIEVFERKRVKVNGAVDGVSPAIGQTIGQSPLHSKLLQRKKQNAEIGAIGLLENN